LDGKTFYHLDKKFSLNLFNLIFFSQFANKKVLVVFDETNLSTEKRNENCPDLMIDSAL